MSGSFAATTDPRAHRRAALQRALTWIFAFLALGCAVIIFHFVRRRIHAALEEGNLWIRGRYAAGYLFPGLGKDGRRHSRHAARLSRGNAVVSQWGGPTTHRREHLQTIIEFLADLKPVGKCGRNSTATRDALIAAISHSFEQYPGVDFNFSQNIQDNVEGSHVRRQGRETRSSFLATISKSSRVSPSRFQGIMQKAPGITDVASSTSSPVNRACWFPSNRTKAARYGLSHRTSTTWVQAAVGGGAVTQIIDNDRRFDFAVR